MKWSEEGSKMKGISFVEVMVTVAILGILSAVTAPKFADTIRKTTESSTKSSLTLLRSSLLIYFADNIGVDVSTLSALTTTYIDTIPQAKIGAYHPDSDSVVSALTFGGPNVDIGGWYYITPSGTIFVNCTHTDTKGAIITTW